MHVLFGISANCPQYRPPRHQSPPFSTIALNSASRLLQSFPTPSAQQTLFSKSSRYAIINTDLHDTSLLNIHLLNLDFLDTNLLDLDFLDLDLALALDLALLDPEINLLNISLFPSQQVYPLQLLNCCQVSRSPQIPICLSTHLLNALSSVSATP